MGDPELKLRLDDFLAGTAGFTGLATRIVRACAAAQPDGPLDAARDAAQDSIAGCHEPAGNGSFTVGGDFVPVYRSALDETNSTRLDRKADAKLEWTYFAGGDPPFWRELRRVAPGTSPASPFTLFQLWVPHILCQLPRIIGEVAKQPSRPIATHGLPKGSFGERKSTDRQHAHCQVRRAPSARCWACHVAPLSAARRCVLCYLLRRVRCFEQLLLNR